MQIEELQKQIDELYRSAFADVEVTYKPQSTQDENEASTNVTERFADLNESSFGLLGRQRQHVMKVGLSTHPKSV